MARQARARLAPMGSPGGEPLFQDVLFEAYRPVLERRRGAAGGRTAAQSKGFKDELSRSLDDALASVLTAHYQHYLEECLGRSGQGPAKGPTKDPTKDPFKGPATRTKTTAPHLPPATSTPPATSAPHTTPAPHPTSAPQAGAASRTARAPRTAIAPHTAHPPHGAHAPQGARDPYGAAAPASRVHAAPADAFDLWLPDVPARAVQGLARSISGLMSRAPARQQAYLLGVLIDRLDPRAAAQALGLADPGLAAYDALRPVAEAVAELPSDTLRGFAAAIRRQGAPIPDGLFDRPIAIPLPPPSQTAPGAGALAPASFAFLGPLAFDPAQFAWQRSLAELTVTLTSLARRQWPKEAGGLCALACLIARVLGPLARPASPAGDPSAGRAPGRAHASAPLAAERIPRAAPQLHKRIRELLGI